MKSEAIDNILESLEGAFVRGKTYFIKTVTYHYVGTVNSVGSIGNNYYIMLEKVIGIGQAGNAADATVQIVTGKAKPEQFEVFPPDHLLRIWVHAITEDQMLTISIRVK